MEDMRLRSYLTTVLPANWKVVVDAFNEAYHVQGTHPELLEYSDDVNVQIDLYGRHSRFIFPVGLPSPRLGRLSKDVQHEARSLGGPENV